MRKKVSAFSLIEISIALVIVGLMISGVLKGKELLENAKIQTILNQINRYKIANNNFLEQYGALPGDYNSATINISDQLINGNNDGIIAGNGFDGESAQYWLHLQNANLIDEKLNDKGLPTTKTWANIIMLYKQEEKLAGHFFAIVGFNSQANQLLGSLTPKQALSILHKSNNSDPFSGSIQVRNGFGQQCFNTNGSFNIKNKQRACVLYVSME